MSMIPFLFSLAVALMRQACVCLFSDPDVCRLVTDASVDVEKSQLAAVRSEMAMFESSGKRGRCLELVYRYLPSIPSSSIDAERTFSAAGVLCTKVGSRLTGVRSYYQKNKQYFWMLQHVFSVVRRSLIVDCLSLCMSTFIGSMFRCEYKVQTRDDGV